MGEDDHCCQLVSDGKWSATTTYQCFSASISSEEQQLERMMNRDGFSEEEAQQRIASQLPLSEKIRRANYVIDNSQEVRFTEQQAFALYHEMRRRSVYCGLYKWLMVLVLLLVTFAVAVLLS